MCGIVGYIGRGTALPLLVEGLRRLEYRGYDSAGVAVFDTAGDLWVRKSVGRVEQLAKGLKGSPANTRVGIAHTRWATHGGVTEPNAHPHTDEGVRIAVVHNGIIENMSALKAQLVERGVTFRSETDTELLPHLIRQHYAGDPLAAVQATLQMIRGTYGIAVLFADHPDLIICARHGSPLVVGLGDGETVIASDPQAVVAHTRRVVYLEDRELAVVTADGCQLHRLGGGEVDSNVETIDMEYEVADGRGIPNLGERRCVMWTENATEPRKINLQVPKPAMSTTGLNRPFPGKLVSNCATKARTGPSPENWFQSVQQRPEQALPRKTCFQV